MLFYFFLSFTATNKSQHVDHIINSIITRDWPTRGGERLADYSMCPSEGHEWPCSLCTIDWCTLNIEIIAEAGLFTTELQITSQMTINKRALVIIANKAFAQQLICSTAGHRRLLPRPRVGPSSRRIRTKIL